ncbi:MAG: ATP phosphoribosyltransferase [Hydrogenophilus sp.]|nr:ATP phosphoribosyltransferase [Hydrogenophilus sp.]
MKPVTIAVAKGRIFSEMAPLLAAAGLAPVADAASSRQLILPTQQADVQLVVVRAADVPTYVQYGGADLGVTGKDVLGEHGWEGLYELADLGVALCRLAVAAPDGFAYEEAIRLGRRLRVATKYVVAARDHFAAKGVHVDLIRLYGSMELAPLVGLADAIVDLVSTGRTLQANGLVEVETIAPVSSRLIVNQAALKMNERALFPVVESIVRAANERLERS